MWIILETVKWIALCVKCGQCLCWRLIILLSRWHCQFGKVHEALCWWSTKQTFFCGTHRVVLFTRSTVTTMPRLRLTCAIVNDFGQYPVPYGTVWVDVVLILHVSRTTKMTVTLFSIISTYSTLAAEKSKGTIDRITADSPYNGALCSGASRYHHNYRE